MLVPAVSPVVTLPSSSVATPVPEGLQQRLLVQLAAQQSSIQPTAGGVVGPRPAISVIQLRPASTTAPPTTLALPAPLTIRGSTGQPLTLVAAPTTSGVQLNQVRSAHAATRQVMLMTHWPVFLLLLLVPVTSMELNMFIQSGIRRLALALKIWYWPLTSYWYKSTRTSNWSLMDLITVQAGRK